MLNKPENFQEARKIIENAVDDDLQTKRMKNAKLRSMFIFGAGIAAAIGAGVITQDPTIGALSVPSSVIITAPFTLKYFLMKYTKDRIKNGDYFRENDPDKIMDAARDYVDEYNKYEEKQRRL